MSEPTSDAGTADGHAHPPRALWLVAPLAIIVLAVAMRAGVSFSAPIPPGVDAAYYPLQARSLLESGRLAYHDLPAIFVLDAAFAKLLMVFGMDIDAASLLTSRLVDCVSQPLSAIPIFALGLAWAGQKRRTWGLLAAITGAALLATVSLPMLRMTSDFEKNSLGLVWLAGAAWAANQAIARPSRRRWAILALMVALAALTHVAVFGATVVLVGVALLARLFTHKRPSFARLMLGLGVCVALLAGTLLAIYVASPTRAATLIAAPFKLFQNQGRSRDAGPQRDQPDRAGAPEFSPDGGPDAFGPMDGPPDFDMGEGGPLPVFPEDGPPGFDEGPPPPPPAMRTAPGGPIRSGGPGGPPAHNDPLPPTIILVVNVVAAWSLWRAWRDRANLSSGQLCVVIGAAATSLVLASPLLRGDYFMRLSLMAPLPASILLLFLFVRRSLRGKSSWPALAMSAATIATVLVGLGLVPTPPRDVPSRQAQHAIGETIIDEAAAEELRAMRTLITDEHRTVVLARHGLQWWAGFLMHVPVREDRVSTESLEKYDRVLTLIESRGARPIRRGNGPIPAPRQAVPHDGTLLHDGTHFRLYEVRNRLN